MKCNQLQWDIMVNKIPITETHLTKPISTFELFELVWYVEYNYCKSLFYHVCQPSALLLCQYQSNLNMLQQVKEDV